MMCLIIEELASERNIGIDDANYFFKALSDQLISRIPAMKEVMNDVFSDAEDDILREHISKLIVLLQQQHAQVYKTWLQPNQYIIRLPGCDLIL